ncbi:hypothetical protein CHARACLAT_021594 [Characodon lateralis]|uniref:Uncharacterized protein n=1 Tax=Characodon lateralis TaxID=208331 RepID=A0ABU7EBP1_9TELE|nr:hypothetical protein [Characodon lateralis]
MLLRWTTEQKKESSIGTRHSHRLPHFLGSRSFVHDPKFMPIDEGRNKDRPVNLFTTTDQHSVLITVAAAPSADLLHLRQELPSNLNATLFQSRTIACAL